MQWQKRAGRREKDPKSVSSTCVPMRIRFVRIIFWDAYPNRPVECRASLGSLSFLPVTRLFCILFHCLHLLYITPIFIGWERETNDNQRRQRKVRARVRTYLESKISMLASSRYYYLKRVLCYQNMFEIARRSMGRIWNRSVAELHFVSTVRWNPINGTIYPQILVRAMRWLQFWAPKP